MLFYYPIFDWTLFLLLPAFIFALIAQYRVNHAFKWGSTIKTSHGMTGAQTARRILDENGLYHISVQRVPGHLTDHYSPKEDTIFLSEANSLDTYKNTTVQFYYTVVFLNWAG